jgi:hypothetical protein
MLFLILSMGLRHICIYIQMKSKTPRPTLVSKLLAEGWSQAEVRGVWVAKEALAWSA